MASTVSNHNSFKLALSWLERCVIKAIRNHVALCAIHTNLPHVMGGVNAKLAEKLGLQNCRILAPKKGLVTKLITFCPIEHLEKVRSALFEAGAGQLGSIMNAVLQAMVAVLFVLLKRQIHLLESLMKDIPKLKCD